jgi:hypothetical protein
VQELQHGAANVGEGAKVSVSGGRVVNRRLPPDSVDSTATSFVIVVVVNGCPRKSLKADVTQKSLSEAFVL